MLVDLSEGYKINSLLIEVRDDYRVCCKECNNWVKISTPDAQIKHSRSCVSEPQIEKIKKSTLVKKSHLSQVAKKHLDGFCVDPDDVYDAYAAGHLTISQAMNSDF